LVVIQDVNIDETATVISSKNENDFIFFIFILFKLLPYSYGFSGTPCFIWWLLVSTFKNYFFFGVGVGFGAGLFPLFGPDGFPVLLGQFGLFDVFLLII
jgi:nitrate reductase NapE component